MIQLPSAYLANKEKRLLTLFRINKEGIGVYLMGDVELSQKELYDLFPLAPKVRIYDPMKYKGETPDGKAIL